jgi:chromate reductase
MSTTKTVKLFGLSGSLRKESYSTAILKTLAEAVSAEATVTFGDIGSLPHYNQDDDGDHPPEPVAAMRRNVSESAGLVIVSPEYNHGVPGVLKNTIDWLSRPASKSALVGKPVLIVTSSPAFTGGVRSQAQLRESLISAMARPLIANEVVIASVHGKILNGRLKDQASIDFAMKALRQLIEEARAHPAAQAA